ncbi:hypothetical protein B0H11DRAFT_2263378 [Mycena galericulata]|nr:hypothetical protein B0H11DRAFT_2263378 [Mycena galericulata]
MVSKEVQDAFPRRAAEENPFIIHYDESGARIQMIPTGYNDQDSTLDDSKVTRRLGQTETSRYRIPGYNITPILGSRFETVVNIADPRIEEIAHLNHLPNRIRQVQVTGVEEALKEVAVRLAAVALPKAVALLTAVVLHLAEVNQEVEDTVQGAAILAQAHQGLQVLLALLARLVRQDLLAAAGILEEAEEGILQRDLLNHQPHTEMLSQPLKQS